MADYPSASVQNDLDTLARIYELIDAALGDATENETASMGGAIILARVLDTEDYTPVSALVTEAYGLSENLKTATAVSGRVQTAQSLVADYVRALKRHLNNDIDAYLTAQSMKAHEYFNTLYYQIFGSYLTAANVFPANTTLGRVDKAAGEWAYTDGSAIDTDYYAPAQLELYVPTGYTIGAADCVLTVTCVDADGDETEEAATMPQNSVAGTAVAIGTSSDAYVSVDTAVVTGGTDGDRVEIRSKLLRDINTACTSA